MRENYIITILYPLTFRLHAWYINPLVSGALNKGVLGSHHMQINPDKFQYIVFDKHDNVSNLIIGNNVIIPETNVKILGLHLDNKLNFHEHVSKLCNKVGKQVQVISRLSRVLSESNKMLL